MEELCIQFMEIALEFVFSLLIKTEYSVLMEQCGQSAIYISNVLIDVIII